MCVRVVVGLGGGGLGGGRSDTAEYENGAK